MISRSTLPGRAQGQREGLTTLFPGSRIEKQSALFVVAHPGDEIIAAGGAFQDLDSPGFLHVTDGASRDMQTALEAGFVDRQEYARARREEFLAALSCAGLRGDEAIKLDFAAGELTQNLAMVTTSLARALREIGADIVITMPYEGIHPDHDAIAFATQSACDLLRSENEKAPERIEAAGYSERTLGAVIGEFQARSNTRTVSVRLEEERRRMKQCMIERMPIRLRQLRNLSLETESFRVAPHYDFTEAASLSDKPEPVANGRRWRRMAADALRVLGLSVG
jgi:LmbE family N-acetylglucosaminyl deacetylase